MGQSYTGLLPTNTSGQNMLLVVAAAALLAVCSAAPQYYYPYPVYAAPYPSMYAYQGYPVYPAPDTASSRLITFSNLQSVTGTMDASGSYTVSGSVEFKQNLVTGDSSKYNIYINGAGAVANMKYKIGVGSACSATPTTQLVEVTSPLFLINGFYVKGTSTTVNVDGSGSKVAAKGMYVSIINAAGTLVGCTNAVLA